MRPEKVQSLQFTIRINGHTTQIVYNDDSSFLSLNSPDLDRVLALSIGQGLPNDLSLGDISLLALFPPETDWAPWTIISSIQGKSKVHDKSSISEPEISFVDWHRF